MINLFLISLISAACASATTLEISNQYQSATGSEVHPGVTIEEFNYDKRFKLPVRIHKVEIDLNQNQIKPLLFPNCKKISEEGKKQGAIVAINGTYFTSACTSRNLTKLDNQVFSTNTIRQAGSVALLVDKDGHVSMRMTNRDENPGEAVHGIGGFPMLVENNEVRLSPLESTGFFVNKHPRTAVGIYSDQRLVFVVADGRSPTSRGLTLHELAEYMASLGVESAMNLDGGGSTVLWSADEGIINDPSDSQGERRVADGLAIYANPVPTSVSH